MEPQKSEFKVVVFEKTHAQKIAGFQLKMAKQTQNLDLICDLVIQAVNYILDHKQLGFYLTKLHGSIPIGSLLLTFQNTQSWWIQSVYIEKDNRRQGHFKSLFNEACILAKSNGVHSIKLYAQSQNERAKDTYRYLGMNMNGQKFYTYDFVYGKMKIEEFQKRHSQSNIVFKDVQMSQIHKNEKFRDILAKQYVSKNRPIEVYKGQELIGVVFYFTQFSQWRFGLAYYIDSLYLAKGLGQQSITEIHNGLCSYFSTVNELKVGALRYIFRQKSEKIYENLKEGEIEHYDVMVINF